jgi:hypothetical protein
MPDGDGISSHQNCLDEEANDFSVANRIQAFNIALQSRAEVAEGVTYAQT